MSWFGRCNIVEANFPKSQIQNNSNKKVLGFVEFSMLISYLTWKSEKTTIPRWC
jgi:hypothetical protein